VAADPERSARSVLISRWQQFDILAITYQRRVVQSRRGGNTVVVSRLHDCVVGVPGVPHGGRSRIYLSPTQEIAAEFASRCSRPRIARQGKPRCPPGLTGPK